MLVISISIESLDKFKRHNGCYPARVIIYRDGLSDGQFAYAHEFEIPQVQASFVETEVNYWYASKQPLTLQCSSFI